MAEDPQAPRAGEAVLSRPRQLAVRVLVDLAFLASAASVVGMLGDWWWPCELVAHLRGCWWIGLLPIALGLFALGARWAAAVTALFLLIDLGFDVQLSFGAGPEPGPRDVRVLVANVNVVNERTVPFLELVAAEDPDVIAVFEYGRGWEDALAVLDSGYPHCAKLPRIDAFGIALWSRIPCARLELVESENHVFSVDALLRDEWGELALLAVHPPRPGLTSPPVTRNAELRAAAERAARATAPVALVGDLNTTEHAPIFRELLEVGGLRDARAGFGRSPTWPGRFAPVGIAIDHALVGEGVAVVDHRVGPAIGSDHRPLIVDLAVRGEQER